jgi:hypothetical protein
MNKKKANIFILPTDHAYENGRSSHESKKKVKKKMGVWAKGAPCKCGVTDCPLT